MKAIAFPLKLIATKKSIKENAMASRVSVMVNALGIKGMHVNKAEYIIGESVMYGEWYRRDYISVHARPYKRIRERCPVCGKKCSLYDHKALVEVGWRSNSLKTRRLVFSEPLVL